MELVAARAISSSFAPHATPVPVLMLPSKLQEGRDAIR
jgi:hypothetical protein